MRPARRFAAEQLTVLTAQANIMTLQGDLDRFEETGASEIADTIETKLGQVSEAGFDVSAFRTRFDRLRRIQ